MTSKADQIKANAERIRQKAAAASVNTAPAPEPEEAPAPASPSATTSRPKTSTRSASSSTAPLAPKAKPIRSTVDLPPTRHAALKSWCGEAAVELGRSRVTTQDVVGVLVARLLTDEVLARKIRADLRETQ